MNTKVEIGTPEQQTIIRQELSGLQHVCDYFDPPLPLLEVIVPRDFDATINRIQERTSFKSERKHGIVGAKTIYQREGAIIVLSPGLYTELHDVQTRLVLCFHELLHIHNSRRFPQMLEWSKIPFYYFDNLYILYDEYWADRRAFAIGDGLFPQRSEIYRNHIHNGVSGFVEMLTDDSTSYVIIKKEILSFRQHGDVTRFLRNIDEVFDGIIKAMVHAYAYIDHFQCFADQETALQTSKFVNDRTQRLIGFMRSKYNEDSVDLLDGIPLMEAFMSNFGVRFEILPSGQIYCHVLDI
jgi:hypothetical protein